MECAAGLAVHAARTLVDVFGSLLQAKGTKVGCPSCVGPVGEVGERGKEVAARIVTELRSC